MSGRTLRFSYPSSLSPCCGVRTRNRYWRTVDHYSAALRTSKSSKKGERRDINGKALFLRGFETILSTSRLSRPLQVEQAKLATRFTTWLARRIRISSTPNLRSKKRWLSLPLFLPFLLLSLHKQKRNIEDSLISQSPPLRLWNHPLCSRALREATLQLLKSDRQAHTAL